ncbi:hypothetical protein [Parasphingorhabdus marina]|nr:hypothetical protein [Parasphingorhabdus marina]
MKKILVATMASICLLSACSDAAKESSAESDADVLAEENATDTGPNVARPVESVEPSEFSRSLDQGFRTGWTQSFVSNCVKEAGNSGAPEEVVRPVCECSSGEVLARLTDMQELAQPPEKKMMDALQICVARSRQDGQP